MDGGEDAGPTDSGPPGDAADAEPLDASKDASIDTGSDTGTPPGDAGADSGDGAAGGVTVSLAGTWVFSNDSNVSPYPTVTFNGASAGSASISSVGFTGGLQCACNAYHLIIPLGATFSCASTVQFDFTTNASPNSFGFTNNTAIWLRFNHGTTHEAELLGSEQTGNSSCAFSYGNSFPATPLLKEGTNVIPLASLVTGTSGFCNGSFEIIDVHLQAYGCFPTDTSTSTISNVRMY